MNQSNTVTERRLARLDRVLASRRARLASAIASQQERVADKRPLASLQRYGYPLALLLALLAVSPTIAGFALRRRKLFFGAAANGFGLWTLRRRFGAARRTGSGR